MTEQKARVCCGLFGEECRKKAKPDSCFCPAHAKEYVAGCRAIMARDRREKAARKEG